MKRNVLTASAAPAAYNNWRAFFFSISPFNSMENVGSLKILLTTVNMAMAHVGMALEKISPTLFTNSGAAKLIHYVSVIYEYKLQKYIYKI